jgi:hypothetical protein
MKQRTTCKRCRKANGPLYTICRSLDGRRVLHADANRATKRRHSLCNDCATREIERRDRIDRMEPGAVGFVLANGGRL